MKFKINICLELKRKSDKRVSYQRIIFDPKEAETLWNEIEIFPIYEDEDGICDIVNEGNESYWSVFLHQIGGGLRCIANLPSKNEAIKFAQLINILSQTKTIHY
jgi:hypothetical protein